jgi:hypothetical protein
MGNDQELALLESSCCECGCELYYVRDKILKEGDMYEGTKMICIEEDCVYDTYIHFNDDGSFFESCYDRKSKEWVR